MPIESADEFIALRTSDDPRLYSRAAHDEAPRVVWAELIANHPEMRFWVAQNKTVPVEVIAVLAEDDDPRVRDMVARKRRTPESVQLELANDPDSAVRFALACNARVTVRALQLLADDAVLLVSERAKERLEAETG